MTYTSIKTTGGWSTNTVTEAYDLLFRWQLKAMPICRQFVTVRPEQPTHRGDSVTLQLNQFFDAAAVLAATTPLDEETDVTPRQLPATKKVTLTPNEYGDAVVRTIKLANRGMVPIDPVIAKAVGQHCGDTVDYLVQSAMREGTQVLYGGSATATGEVGPDDTATAHQIRRAVTNLRSASAQTRDGQFYVGVIHPDVVLDLREESGAGAWRVPKEYINDREIITGEFGEFEGVRFMQTPTVLRSGDDDGDATDGSAETVYRTFILGQEALAEAVVTEPHTVLSPVTDKLKRFQGIGWYADLDFGVFRDEALVRLETAASA